MYSKKQIANKLLATLLLLVFLYPNAIAFSHIFEDHDHVSCNNTSLHFHKGESDCTICDFQLVSFNFEVYNSPQFFEPNIPSNKVKSCKDLLFCSVTKTTKQLRAPPSILL